MNEDAAYANLEAGLKDINETLQKLKEKVNTLQVRSDVTIMISLCLVAVIVAVHVVFAIPISPEESVQHCTSHGYGDLENQLYEKDHAVRQMMEAFPAVYFTCRIKGKEPLSATVNFPIQIVVEVSNTLGIVASNTHAWINITAELRSVAATNDNKTYTTVSTEVSLTNSTEYEVSFTAHSKGHYKLHITINGTDIRGSPFNITLYPDPRTQLGPPSRIVTGFNRPWGIDINSEGEAVVSEWWGNTVSVLTGTVKRSLTFERIWNPRGVVIDSEDNIYVVSNHKLQKFNRDGKLIASGGQKGKNKGEFDNPQGVRLRNGRVLVFDGVNHRIQSIDAQLTFQDVHTVGTWGEDLGEFKEPYDVDFDSSGNAYIVDRDNHRIQVMDASGQFQRQFGHEAGKGKLRSPTAIKIIGSLLYVSDGDHHRIAIYETSGQFVTAFGSKGSEAGQFNEPHGIAVDRNGSLYVCDFSNDRIVIY